MNRIYITGFLLIGITIALLAIEVFHDTNFIDKTFISGLLGSFFGALSVAFTVFIFQLRMEQTRYLAELTNKIDTLFASQDVWKRNESSNKWHKCEFRQAVGLSEWKNDPYKDQIKDGQDAPDGVDWNGVLYKIDENFIISSKSMHDYSNWIQLIITGLRSHLLTSKDVIILWRSLADCMTGNDRYGMRMWAWHFVCGDDPNSQDSNSVGFRKIEKIVNSLHSAKEYIDNKNKHLNNSMQKRKYFT